MLPSLHRHSFGRQKNVLVASSFGSVIALSESELQLHVLAPPASEQASTILVKPFRSSRASVLGIGLKNRAENWT